MSKKRGYNNGMVVEELVVLAKKHAEVLVEKREILEPSAMRIHDIRAELKDLQLDVLVIKMEEEDGEAKIRIKVIVQGILNKQIFWIGKDNMIHTMQVNEPFSTFVLFTQKDIEHFGSVDPDTFDFDPDRIQAQFWNAEVEGIVSHLISPNRLVEKVIIGFDIVLKQLTLVEE